MLENAKVKHNVHSVFDEHLGVKRLPLTITLVTRGKHDHLVTIGYGEYVYVDNHKQQCDVIFLGGLLRIQHGAMVD